MTLVTRDFRVIVVEKVLNNLSFDTTLKIRPTPLMNYLANAHQLAASVVETRSAQRPNPFISSLLQKRMMAYVMVH